MFLFVEIYIRGVPDILQTAGYLADIFSLYLDAGGWLFRPLERRARAISGGRWLSHGVPVVVLQ
jgi:hypothetical protein